ncbi:hypothetical protein Tco_1407022 [Tanacetum coccineum]
MALPNEHQLTFDQYVDAQSMFAAIKARFGGNEATKKTQKALLKQQYENFNASSSESLDSIFNRLQSCSNCNTGCSLLPPEDLNVKFLRSLPSEWDTHVVVWMNKPDFDTMGLDDLYNNFKIVEQKVKRSAGANNDDKNLAFLTTSGASSTNNINTVNPEVSTGTTKVNTASTEIKMRVCTANVVRDKQLILLGLSDIGQYLCLIEDEDFIKRSRSTLGEEVSKQPELKRSLDSTSGIRACALRNFDLGEMELENSQNNALAKLPMLKLGEYEMWEIRIKQYFQIQDYALWEVIGNGNSLVHILVTATETGPSTGLKMIMPSTTEEKICKKDDVKARSLLPMALLNEHQLTFDQLQKLISRLAILGVVAPPEDLNV